MMKARLLLLLLVTSLAPPAMARQWFVSQADPNASDAADGSAGHPFGTINAAAQLAQPGDVVTVGAGIYHEWVSPARGGSADAPILYRSVPERAAIVRGTDILDAQWQALPEVPGVFAAPLPQKAFVFGNPFVRPPDPWNIKKLNSWKPMRDAMVFFNDQVLPQVTTRQELMNTPNGWMSTDDGQQLLIHPKDNSAPAAGTVEITTRDRVFAPHRRGQSYVHVEGFIFERCATRRGFPQLGALSTRSGQYWVIRNNVVRDTTGRGIDCGSETWEPAGLIDTEAADKHILIGGHHLVEGNLLSDNAEGGIAAWNTDYVRITGNIVRDNCTSAIGSEHSLADFEAGGIKVHAFRDGVIEGNLVVNNSSFGVWLDNGWERARVTRNVCIGNHGAGIFVELGFGPILIDHNLSAANVLLDPPYLGDGVYTHDSSGVTIVHNTFLDNAHYGVEQIVVTERPYGPAHMAEASNETITGNLFYGNKVGALFLPLLSPRSHDNVSDYNAIAVGESFGINGNAGRIPVEMIHRECRDRLEAAGIPRNEWPDLSDPKQLPILSLREWRLVMQMDQQSATFPQKFKMHLDQSKHPVLRIDMPGAEAIPVAPAGPADDFDLLGHAVSGDAARGPRAGAIQHLQAGSQSISLWPLPTPARTTSTNTSAPAEMTH